MPESTRRTRHGALPRFLVERYDPGLTLALIEAGEPGVRQAARALTSEGQPVRYLGSTLIPAEETAFYLFEANDPQSVEEASRLARLPFDRIVRVVESRERQSSRRPLWRREPNHAAPGLDTEALAPKEES